MKKKAPRTCNECGWIFPVDAAPAECFRCEAERLRVAAMAKRQAAEEEALRRLGGAPLSKSIRWIRLGLQGAQEGIGPALRYARGGRAKAIRRAAGHVAKALEAIEESEAADFAPTWPAP